MKPGFVDVCGWAGGVAFACGAGTRGAGGGGRETTAGIELLHSDGGLIRERSGSQYFQPFRLHGNDECLEHRKCV